MKRTRSKRLNKWQKPSIQASPNVKQLQRLTDFGTFNPALPAGHPFSGVQSTYYWSSTTFAENLTVAWLVLLSDGSTDGDFKDDSNLVWPVRGGQ
jgi:Protein of unknown function (DUF1566)